MEAAPVALNKLGVILLIEDDADIRAVIAEVLADEGFEVVGLPGGAEALEWLDGNPTPRLILLDLYMPGMSGEKFREHQLGDARHASIPVVVVSAANDAPERAQGMGAAAYLRKPIHLACLIETINTHC